MRRTIFHVDMDAFYASVEQRDHPEYKGKPVVVGADPKAGRGRGVVAACSYEARRLGIRSAMPISKAFRLGPTAVYLRPDFEKYVKVSRAVREIFHGLTPLVEPLSIDEAFLDVSQSVSDDASALELARQLKREILVAQRLTASVGVGPNKFIAKVASDLEKPDGLVLVRDEEVQKFLDPLPVSRLWGVGPKTEIKLRELGLETILALRHFDKEILLKQWGRLGEQLWLLAHGIDDRPVITGWEPKSLGHEITFSEDVLDTLLLEKTLEELSESVFERLSEHGVLGKTVTLKLRYSDFTTITRQRTFTGVLADAAEIRSAAWALLRKFRDPKRRVRLVGVSVSSLQPSAPEKPQRQLKLFQ